MPRSKQTAKKSTGAPAPRMQLLPRSVSMRSARKVSEKKALLLAATRPSRAKKTNTENISIMIESSLPTHVLTVQVLGPINENANMDQDHDEVRDHVGLLSSFFPNN
jgi:hypothetical protein